MQRPVTVFLFSQLFEIFGHDHPWIKKVIKMHEYQYGISQYINISMKWDISQYVLFHLLRVPSPLMSEIVQC